MFFFFNDTATTEIYTLSLHDALPILMNPVTLTYFAALILGSAGGVATTATGAMLFVAGAFLASLSWQTSLAVVGAVLGHRMSDRTRIVTGLLGAVVILLLAVRMLLAV